MSPAALVMIALAFGVVFGTAALAGEEAEQPGFSEWTQPTEADFQRIVGRDPAVFLDTVLTIIETKQVPLTLEGVKKGNKLFGAQILHKSDLTPVLLATNTETANPLLHGEVTAITKFYEELAKDERLAPGDTIFVSTHEPCPLCLSSITWGASTTSSTSSPTRTPGTSAGFRTTS